MNLFKASQNESQYGADDVKVSPFPAYCERTDLNKLVAFYVNKIIKSVFLCGMVPPSLSVPRVGISRLLSVAAIGPLAQSFLKEMLAFVSDKEINH